MIRRGCGCLGLVTVLAVVAIIVVAVTQQSGKASISAETRTTIENAQHANAPAIVGMDTCGKVNGDTIIVVTHRRPQGMSVTPKSVFIVRDDELYAVNGMARSLSDVRELGGDVSDILGKARDCL